MSASRAASLRIYWPPPRDRRRIRGRAASQGLAVSEPDRGAGHRPLEACFTFGDFRSRSYSDSVIAALGLTAQRHLLPPIVDGTQTTFPLTAGAAALTGLRAGHPVSLWPCRCGLHCALAPAS